MENSEHSAAGNQQSENAFRRNFRLKTECRRLSALSILQAQEKKGQTEKGYYALRGFCYTPQSSKELVLTLTLALALARSHTGAASRQSETPMNLPAK
jgi:hypothetical protein